ncbi:unnamed protein product [Bursaphelenchus xylophilus]|uniref:(pine wood nematode) hypothetical protein n=1 Tax=Bursaphelenchus xylophilus TaxID=6326 RepID=A0A1I7SQE2_BURXY|nr:unnamed protein product [Bursaphelenchus xylophilus]CAG9109777.1 unnamed protein product [Bursaphelenchus xylophilus]
MSEHIAFELFNCGSGVLLTLYVMFLAIAKTRDQGVKVFSKMLATKALIDFLYSMVSILSLPSISFSTTRLITVMTNPFLPRALLWPFFMAQVFFIYLSVMILPIQFVYRYRVASSQPHSFNTVLTPLLYIVIFLGIHSAILPYTFQGPSKEYDILLKDLNVDSNGRKYTVGDVVRNSWIIPHFVNCIAMVTASYVTMYVYYMKTKRCLTRFEDHLSETTKIAQKQMKRVLVLQALYPIFLICLPCLIMPIAPLINYNSIALGRFCMSALHMTPALSSLSVIFCVPSYRKFTLSLFSSEKIPSCTGFSNSNPQPLQQTLPTY